MTVKMVVTDDATGEEIMPGENRWVVSYSRLNINKVPVWENDLHYKHYRGMTESIDMNISSGDIVEFTVKWRNY